MPVVVPTKKPASPAPEQQAPAPASVSQEELKAALSAQAAAFEKQLDAVKRAFASALTAVAAQPKDKPAGGWEFKANYLNDGSIDTIVATPLKLH